MTHWQYLEHFGSWVTCTARMAASVVIGGGWVRLVDADPLPAGKENR